MMRLIMPSTSRWAKILLAVGGLLVLGETRAYAECGVYHTSHSVPTLSPFKPATQNGRPVSVSVPAEVIFALK